MLYSYHCCVQHRLGAYPTLTKIVLALHIFILSWKFGDWNIVKGSDILFTHRTCTHHTHKIAHTYDCPPHTQTTPHTTEVIQMVLQIVFLLVVPFVAGNSLPFVLRTLFGWLFDEAFHHQWRHVFVPRRNRFRQAIQIHGSFYFEWWQDCIRKYEGFYSLLFSQLNGI